MRKFAALFLAAFSCHCLCVTAASQAAFADTSNISGDQDKTLPTVFPDLVDADNKHASHGKGTLPFAINLAKRPELMHPQYLRMVFGSPLEAKGYSYPANNFSWASGHKSMTGAQTKYYLSRTPIAGSVPGSDFECRQFVIAYAQSSIRLKDVYGKLGKPARKYFDNQAAPVELYQVTPFTTLAVSEPCNTFDVNRITVTYNGPALPATGPRDMFAASSFRQKAIDHHLSDGTRDRGLSYLQEHVDDNPQDIGAHLLMGETLKNRSDINGSIAEYRRALALAQASGDKSMERKALKGLDQFGLVPPSGAPVAPFSVSQQGTNPH
jgi:hypothetical protein